MGHQVCMYVCGFPTSTDVVFERGQERGGLHFWKWLFRGTTYVFRLVVVGQATLLFSVIQAVAQRRGVPPRCRGKNVWSRGAFPSQAPANELDFARALHRNGFHTCFMLHASSAWQRPSQSRNASMPCLNSRPDTPSTRNVCINHRRRTFILFYILLLHLPLQHRRTPVLGDEVYGNKDWNRRLQQSTGLTRPLLHARSLEFKHPSTGEVISLAAPLPADVAAVVRRIYPQVSHVAPLSPFPRLTARFRDMFVFPPPWYWRGPVLLSSAYEHPR